MKDKSLIKDFFKGKNIFITGASGFIGKALIEKLLRSCTDIGNIYILLRSKRGKGSHERVEQILSNPLFDVLKSQNPEAIKKIIPINGDTCKLGLGLSEQDKDLLTQQTHLFFHIAASIKFDEPLTNAIFANLRSTREAALLALEMTKIEHFQHVSTTYCNIDNKKFIEEILYPAPVDWKEAIFVAENADVNTLDLLAQHYITDFPNTYTFTKRLAEHCVNELLVGKVPTVICRPSVVIGSLEEPFEGWSDNFNGPVGLLIAGASGLLRIVYADSEIDTDYNAVDNVVKGMIVSAWHNVGDEGNLQEVFIYQMCKGDKLPYKLGNLIEHGKKLYWDIPLERKVWFPRNKSTKCWYEYFITVVLCQVIPAMFFDLVLWIVGYPPTIFKIQRKIYIANMAISHFMLNDWKFGNRKYEELSEILPVDERRDFNFTVKPSSEYSIYNFYMNCGNYVRYYLLKESKEITQKNKTRTFWMYCADWILRVIIYLGLAWIILVKFNVPLNMFNAISLYWINL